MDGGGGTCKRKGKSRNGTLSSVIVSLKDEEENVLVVGCVKKQVYGTPMRAMSMCMV